ncbi:acetyltransferase [Ilyonectria destructans]|nr:acetyltransferase [Ilyonectria destructans]
MAAEHSYVRHARLSDVPTIFKFLRELADYQNELSSFTTTEEKLCKTIAFDPEQSDDGAVTGQVTPFRPARCLLAFNKTGVPAGMALYLYNYVSWQAAPGIYLEDLYVSQSGRRGGHGKRLMDALCEELRAVGGVRIEWRVLEWNKPSISFYESMGAKIMEGWKEMKLEKADIV